MITKWGKHHSVGVDSHVVSSEKALAIRDIKALLDKLGTIDCQCATCDAYRARARGRRFVFVSLVLSGMVGVLVYFLGR